MQTVAVAIGVTTGAVNKWELDRDNPRPHNAQALDDYLEAGGAILAAYGFTTPAVPPSAADLAALAARVDTLERAVEALLGDATRPEGREGSL